jgi:hypothetical protein
VLRQDGQSDPLAGIGVKEVHLLRGNEDPAVLAHAHGRVRFNPRVQQFIAETECGDHLVAERLDGIDLKPQMIGGRGRSGRSGWPDRVS